MITHFEEKNLPITLNYKKIGKDLGATDVYISDVNVGCSVEFKFYKNGEHIKTINELLVVE